MAERPESLVTIGDVHLAAMREHDRGAALLHWDGGRWEETPDWRLDRQVIRLGLYLRERAGLEPGDRVAIVSRLRREWLLADLAAAVQGAVAVAIDPDLPPPALASALTKAAPRAVFVSGPVVLGRLGAVPANVVSFDGPAGSAALLSEALDLGGTLDTAERAVDFRARARGVSPERRALGYVERTEDRTDVVFQTHRQVVAHLEALWSREPARKGDLAYLAGAIVTPGLRLALLAFVGDGLSTVALGTPGREEEELAALRPHKIVAAPGTLGAAVAGRPADHQDGGAGMRGWLEKVARWGPLARERADRRQIREALGGRARWIRSTAALPPAVSRRMGGVLNIDPFDGSRGGAA